jgi:hypothetical protein
VTQPVDVSGAPVRRPGDGQVGTHYQPGMNRQNPAGGRVAYSTGGDTSIEIRVSGALFDGRMRALIAAMIDDMKYAVASQVLADWQLNMDRSFQHPTPYYETQVTVQPVGEDYMVHDRGIVYGPWVEGTSSRNSTTRFKGYASLRRAVDGVRQHKADQICQRIAREYARRWNA